MYMQYNGNKFINPLKIRRRRRILLALGFVILFFLVTTHWIGLQKAADMLPGGYGPAGGLQPDLHPPGEVTAAGDSGPGVSDGAPACSRGPVPSVSTLMKAIEKGPFKPDSGVPSGPIVTALEMDGSPPAEAVLAADIIDAKGDIEESRLWLFRKSSSGWNAVTSMAWPVDPWWDGFYDDTPGFKKVAALELVGPCRDLLHVEHLDMRGGADPRYYVRSFELFRLDGDDLVSVFTCPTAEALAIGPERDGPSTTRTITFKSGSFPGDIIVKTSTSTAVYLYDGRTYVPDDPTVCGVTPGC